MTAHSPELMLSGKNLSHINVIFQIILMCVLVFCFFFLSLTTLLALQAKDSFMPTVCQAGCKNRETLS